MSESISEKILRMMQQRGMSYGELSERTGLYKSALQRYATGSTEKIPLDAIEKIASVFGCPASQLMGWDDEPRESVRRGKGVAIPVLGRVQAGMPVEAVEEILDYEEITQELAATGDFFALQIRGDSMEPKFSEGDVVIVRKQEDADTNDIIVALVNGDEATVKQLKKFEDGSIALVSTNPAYKPFYFSRDEIATLPVVVLGRVVELRAKF